MLLVLKKKPQRAPQCRVTDTNSGLRQGKGWVVYVGPPACVTLCSSALNNEQPESRRSAGWGHSMAGSIAINIYSTSRVVEESAGLEPSTAPHTAHLHKHPGEWSSLLSLSPLFPSGQCNYSTGRQAGPSGCCSRPQSFLCSLCWTSSRQRLWFTAFKWCHLQLRAGMGRKEGGRRN